MGCVVVCVGVFTFGGQSNTRCAGVSSYECDTSCVGVSTSSYVCEEGSRAWDVR